MTKVATSKKRVKAKYAGNSLAESLGLILINGSNPNEMAITVFDLISARSQGIS